MGAVVRRKCQRCELNRDVKFFTPRGRICKPCQKKSTRRTSRVKRVKEAYGLSKAEYELLERAQGGKCAICGGTRRRSLDVDHDHKLVAELGMRRSVRGLLCARCNRHLLPAAMNNPKILLAAAEYLLHPPAHKVLARRRIVRRTPT